MYIRIINFTIFALLAFTSCENKDIQPCTHVTYSDAQPIQFWPIDCATFNEKEEQGVFSKCFCQPFECSDSITVQIKDNNGGRYELKLYDVNDSLLHVFDFIEISSGIFQVTFTPSDYSPDVCDEFIVLKVARIVDASPLINGSFVTTLSPWGQNSTGASWSWIFGDKASVTNTSKLLYQRLDLGDQSYTMTYSGTRSISFGNNILVFSLLDENGNTLATTNLLTGTSTPFSGSYSFNGKINGSLVKYIAFRSSGSFTGTLNLDAVTLTTSTYNQNILKSDCINLLSEWKETVLIEYSNASRDFAGLEYLTMTPDISFQLRVPGIFFEERNPEEQEVIELSNSRNIQLYSQLRTQKFLETGPLPAYMRKKLLLALQHQFVTIGGQDWVKRESHQIIDSNKRWPLRRLTVWLDEKDFIARNVL